MLDEAELTRRAQSGMHALLTRLLRGRIVVEPADGERDWDAMLRRHVHAQDMVAWHEFGELTIGVDAAGGVVHFRDAARFGDDPRYQKLSEEDVLAICATTGLVGRRVERVDITPDPSGLLAATVVQRHQRHPARVRYLIHCQRRQVAQFDALPGAAP